MIKFTKYVQDIRQWALNRTELEVYIQMPILILYRSSLVIRRD